MKNNKSGNNARLSLVRLKKRGLEKVRNDVGGLLCFCFRIDGGVGGVSDIV